MKFEFQESPSIPQLSWVAVVTPGDSSALVVHGTTVETRENFFCDGIWADDFSSNRIDEVFLAGSGGIVNQGKIKFVTADHTLEKLCAIRTGRELIFSNSLVAALETAREELDIRNLHYQNFFQSFMMGLSATAKQISTAGGNELMQFHHAVIDVGPDGTLHMEGKQQPETFSNFDAYFSCLKNTLRKLLENANDARRKKTYSPVVALSGGYDSTAVATLASSLGCKEALVLQQTRQDGSVAVNVAEICKTLGLSIHYGERTGHLNRLDRVEAEFAACGYAAQDVPLVNWEPSLGNRVLLTGIHGDAVWNTHHKKPNTDIVRGDAAGASLIEFRSRVGFMHLPVPFIACKSAAAIKKISISDEMRPWSVGGHYDRPIPRRIVESAGVPRQSFAIQKSGYIARFKHPVNSEPGKQRSSLVIELSAATRQSMKEMLSNYPYRKSVFYEAIGSPLRFVNKKIRLRGNIVAAIIGSLIVYPLTWLFFRRPPSHVLNSPYGWYPLLPIWGVRTISNRYSILRTTLRGSGENGLNSH